MSELSAEFERKLGKLYGEFDSSRKRFERHTNSEIARELGYSDAQFSRLINGSATEGEYQRAIQNVDRILEVQRLEKKLQKLNPKSSRFNFRPLLTVSMVLFITTSIFAWLYLTEETEIHTDFNDRDDMLTWSFETSFVNSYVKLDEMPADCHLPCYKYQGKWELKNPYKIPFYMERTGFHYLATEVSMYARCQLEKSEVGNQLEGYEYQKHEIWYDQREWPVDSFLNEGVEGDYYKDYQQLDFSKDPNFIMVATVHTFFRNEFIVDSTEIRRVGKVIGRDLEFISRENLSSRVESDALWTGIQNELNAIATRRLNDFSRPISCESSPLPKADFHDLQENDEMIFACQLTTSQVPMNYRKAYVLTGQFIKNTCGGS